MVSILFPLGINVAYEHRPYRLGETINLTVELIPRRDVEVREARVDLVWEMRHTEVTTVLVLPLPSQTSRRRERKRVRETYAETDVHSSVVFVKDGRLSSGEATTYNVGLEIGPKRPTHQSGSTRWRLVTTVDIGGAREITARRPVRVTT